MLQLLALICVATVTFANRRVVLPNPSKLFRFYVCDLSNLYKCNIFFLHLDFPTQCYDGKKTFNVGKYFPQTHRTCRQMICREDFTLIYEE